MTSSQGTVSSTIMTILLELDQRTRSGKMSLWIKSTHISQSLAIFSWPASGDRHLARFFSPFLKKDCVFFKVLLAFWGMVFVDTLLVSTAAAEHFGT